VLKVLVISAAYPPMPAGEATNAYHLCRQLVQRGLDVDVLTTRGNNGSGDPGISVHPLMEKWSWSEVPRLRRFLRRSAPDVVYLMYLGWTYNFQFMSTFMPTIVKRTLPGVAMVTRFENVGGAGAHANSVGSRLLRKAVATLDRRGQVDYQLGTLLRDSDSIVLLSSGHERVLQHGLADVGAKCVLIPPPVNMAMSPAGASSRERGRRRLGAGSDEFLFAYIGFIYPGKGLETLLRAFRRLADERPGVRLALIGGSLAREFPDQPNYLEGLQALAAELGIEPRLIWTGEYGWKDDLASTYLRAADACVLPFETGVKLNNSSFSSAAAHGLPIVTTSHGALEPQFVHGRNVYLCEPQVPEHLHLAMAELMDNAGLRERLGNGALQLAHDWYSWEAAMEKTLRLFTPPMPSAPRMVAQSAR
jgi:glycosyltransferase involved in cell wall biosynthesis